MTSLGPWFGGGGRRGADPWSTTGWDVFDPFDFIGNRVGSWGGDRGRDENNPTNALAHANVDWRETENAHIFTADLPGVRREEVKVQVEDNNVLQIRGERMEDKEEDEDGGGKWHRVERRRGSFLRKFRLPDNANLENISAALDHGVLHVTVPKKQISPEEKEQNVRSIEIA